MRLNPLVPNWLINPSAGVLGIPYLIFLSSSAIGALPFNFIWVQAGLALNELETLKVMDTPMLVTMVILALMALIPTLLKEKDSIDTEDKTKDIFNTEMA